jgi:hypothetical protein
MDNAAHNEMFQRGKRPPGKLFAALWPGVARLAFVVKTD